MSFIGKNKKLRKKDILLQLEELQREHDVLSSTVSYGQQLAKIGCWLYEIQTGEVFWSEEVYNLLGCGSNCLSGNLDSFLEYVHQDDLDVVKKMTHFVETAQEYDVEYRIIRADKQVKHVREKTKAIRDENNKPVRMAGIIQDITEQKLKEITLIEIGEDYNKAQQVAGVGSFKHDVSKGKSYATDEIFNILGISRFEFNDDYRNAIKLIHPDDQQRVQEELKKLMSGQAVSDEFRIIQKDGAIKYIRSHAEPVFDKEGVAGFIGTMQDITEKNLLHISLQKSYRSLVEAERLAQIGSWELDLINNEVAFCSEEVCRIYGISKEQLQSIDKKLLINYIHPDDRAIIRDLYYNPPTKQPLHVEFRVVKSDGSVLHTYNIMEITLDKKGIPVFLRGITQDITEKKELQREAEVKQQKINKMQRRFEALLKESVEVFEILDKDGTIIYISEASEKVTGYSAEERQGRKIYDFYDEEGTQIINEMMDFVIAEPEKKITKDLVFKKKDGKEIYLEIYMQNFLQDSDIEGIVVNLRDVTERVKAEKRILHLSSHDQLTGLPNKLHFDKKLEELYRSAEENHTSFAIFMLDIDSLKYIKNTLGYKVVENYIAQIAVKLKLYCESTKFLCRYSTNRFIIIFEGIHGMGDYEAFIRGIYELFSTPLKLDRYELDVDISMGISFYNREEDKEKLIRHAETAIFLAKNAGKNKYVFYSSDLDIQSYKQFILRNDLRKAIDNNQLMFHFQPIVNLKTNEILAAEVLLRWEHPEWGVVSPRDFIYIAEETGYLIKIGNWLLREVCSTYQKWLNSGMPEVKICLNYSRIQFYETNFVENIRETISEFGLDPHFLIMEITESILADNVDKVIADIKNLQSFGIQLALDDFGTGSSLLSGLIALNIDILKIDGSYIKKINKDENSTIITRYLIKMAQDLNVKLVAEHLETWEQLSFLKDLRCFAGQGYLYSRPVPLEDFEGLLRRKRIRPTEVADFVVREERRKYFRIRFTQPLEADLSILEIKGKKVNVGHSKALIKNIGPGGLCFITNIRLPIDRSIILQFKTHLIGEEIIVYGCTIWTSEIDDNLFEYGVEFTFDENKRSDLLRVLNQVQIRMRNDVLFADGSFVSGSGSPQVYFNII